nr:hypothetical protein [Escherichia coli]
MNDRTFRSCSDNLRVGLFFVEFDNSMANNATATQRTLLIGGCSVRLNPPWYSAASFLFGYRR